MSRTQTISEWSFALGIIALFLLTAPATLIAGKVQLENGSTLDGKPVPIMGLTKQLIRQHAGPVNTYPILMVDTGMKRYFVPARQVAEIDKSVELSRWETITLKHKRSGGQLMVQSLGGIEAEPFDKFGRRIVTVNTSAGPKKIVQGISEITPTHLTVNALTHKWEHGISTTSIPAETLDAILRQATDQENPDDRMMIARFYLQAGLYRQAAEELDAIIAEFPELEPTAKEVALELRQLRGGQFLTELRRRRQAGQHRLAYAFLKQFPTEEMSAGVLRQVREMTTELETSAEQIETVRLLLGELQAELTDAEQQAQLANLRIEVSAQLDYASLPRLRAFLIAADDANLSAEAKLALAYSGWMTGAVNPIEDLDKTIQMAAARFLIQEYCREENAQTRRQLLAELSEVEGVGPQTVLQLISYLPMTLETPGLRLGRPIEIDVPASDDDSAVKYTVVVPQEYTPHHRYPVVIALHPAGMKPIDEIIWWGFSRVNKELQPGQAQRRGYIVIAPEYADEDQKQYGYDHTAHRAVLASLDDARKRFSIDSDHVFLSGHGMGGDAAFDLGMSHPDLFAGVIPITGIADHYTKWYWQNAEHVAWYVVGGELDRDSLSHNSRELSRMMRNGFDVTYVEYVGRGYEDYYEQIHELFDWMDLHKRVERVPEMEFRTLRPGDNRFYWLEIDGLPERVISSPVTTPRAKVYPLKLSAKITVGNSIYITSGAERNTIHFSTDTVDFDQRLTIRVNGRIRFNDFPEANLEDILNDFRTRGDRQRITVRSLSF